MVGPEDRRSPESARTAGAITPTRCSSAAHNSPRFGKPRIAASDETAQGAHPERLSGSGRPRMATSIVCRMSTASGLNNLPEVQ